VAAGSVATVCDVTWCGPGVSLLCRIWNYALRSHSVSKHKGVSLIVRSADSRPPGAAAGARPSTPQPRDEERDIRPGTARPSLNIGVHSNSPWNRHGSVVGARASGPVFMLRLMRLHLAGTWAGNRGRQVRATTGDRALTGPERGPGCSQSFRATGARRQSDHVIVLRCPFSVAYIKYWLDDSSQEHPTAITALTSTVSCPSWFLGWQARVFRLAVHSPLSPFQA